MISAVLRMLRITETSLGWHQVGCSRCVDQRWRTTCQWSLRTRHVELPTVTSADLIPGRRSTLGWQNSASYSGAWPLIQTFLTLTTHLIFWLC